MLSDRTRLAPRRSALPHPWAADKKPVRGFVCVTICRAIASSSPAAASAGWRRRSRCTRSACPASSSRRCARCARSASASTCSPTRCASSTTSASAQADLDRVGLPAKEWALVGLNGNDIYSEPRGLLAGYNWPQYAVHRGQFHMLLHDKVVRAHRARTRCGSAAASPATARTPTAASPRLIEHADGSTSRGARRAADRRRRHPLGGARADASRRSRRSTGAARSCGAARPGRKPIRTGASFVGLGTHRQRMVFYPISHPDPQTGLVDDQLDRRGHDGQRRGLEAERLVPPGARSPTSRITSTTGSGTGSTCRR